MEEYYYLDAGNQRQGPVALEDLAAFGVTSQTMVWKKGMENWQAAGMVPEVIAALSASPSPVPPQPPRPGETPSPTPTPAPLVTPSPATGQNPVGNQPPFRHKPDNHLVWAILSTIFCCIPFGIVSIVYASNVDSAWNRGDYNGADSAARSAATWAWVAAGTGFVVNGGWIIYLVFFAAAAGLSGF